MKSIYRIERFEVKDCTDISVRTPTQAYDLFKDTFGDTEEMWALFLNIKSNIVDKYLVAKGGYNTILCTPADIFVPALRLNARNFILAHNHPSGDCNPSKEDIIFTKKVDRAAEYVGMNFVDHLIFANDNFYSFKKQGVI
jgi:DNA repair protein RadC